MKSSHLIALVLSSSLIGYAPAATIIYQDNFNGSAVDLTGTTPDTTTGAAAWVASPNFNADGSTDDGFGSATLAFTPVSGLIYTLDVSYSGLSGTTGDWFALGFVNGQSTGSTYKDRFINNNVVGVAWGFVRGNATALDPDTSTALGTGAFLPTSPGLDGGIQDTEMSATTALDMRIMLDTTGGAAVENWVATWQAKLPASSSYTTLRTDNLLVGSTIGSVGIARSNAGITGTVDSFSLTSVPEPSSVTLLCLSGLALLRRRR